MNSIASAGLPKNGYVVSLLSWLASQQVSVDAINEATLIRTIVEHLLERGRFDAVLRGQFDPEFKEIFLADLGFHLRQMGGGDPYNEVLAFTIDFFTRRNLNFEADRVLRALQNCRILDVSDGYMSFRLPCYQEYFVARFLRDDSDRLSEVRKAKGHCDWSRELDILTALTRRDFGLLEEIQQRLDELFDAVQGSKAAPNFTEYKFNAVFSPPNLRRLRASKLTQDAVDDMQDNAEARAAQGKSADEPQDRDAGKALRDYYILLSLLGRIVRNAEASEGEIKQQALSKFVSNQLRLIDVVARSVSDQRDRLATLMRSRGDQVPNSAVELVMCLLHVIVPSGILSLASRDVNSTKLLQTIRKNVDALDPNDVCRVAYAFIALDIGTGVGVGMLRAIIVSTNNEIIIRMIQIKLVIT